MFSMSFFIHSAACSAQVGSSLAWCRPACAAVCPALAWPSPAAAWHLPAGVAPCAWCSSRGLVPRCHLHTQCARGSISHCRSLGAVIWRPRSTRRRNALRFSAAGLASSRTSWCVATARVSWNTHGIWRLAFCAGTWTSTLTTTPKSKAKPEKTQCGESRESQDLSTAV